MTTEEIVRDFLSNSELRVIFNRDKLREESSELRGYNKGYAEGYAEGERLELERIVKNMLNENASMEYISNITDFSVSEIEKIK